MIRYNRNAYDGNDYNQSRLSPLSIALVSLAMMVLFVPVLFTVATAADDYVAHMFSAMTWERTGQFDRPRPQFLYHLLLVILTRLIPGGSYMLAVTIVGAACYIATGLIIFSWFYPQFISLPPRKRFGLAFLLTLVLMLVGPVSMLTWGKTGTLTDTYFGYLSPHAFHNPTLVLMQPFALLLFSFAVSVFDRVQIGVKRILICAVIAFLCTLAKPNYGIALIPALGLLTLYTLWKRKPPDWWLLILGILLPILGLLGFQYLYHSQGMGGFAFEPLRVMYRLSPDGMLLPKFLLSILFPAAVYLLYWPQTRRDTAFTLAWLSFGIAVAYLYTMVEVNYWSDANFQWGAQITLLIVFLVATLFLIRHYMATRQWTWRLTLCAVLLALHFVGGLAVYLPYINPA